MAGICINTVARRVILKPDASVLQLLQDIQSEQIEISKHEHITLADLISQGMPVSSLFRSLLNFINLPSNQELLASGTRSAVDHLMRNRRLGGLDGYGCVDAITELLTNIVLIPGKTYHSYVHLLLVLQGTYAHIHLQTLTVTPSSIDGFTLEVSYTREVISEADVEVLLNHFEATLLFLAHHPHETVGEVNLLSTEESNCLLYEYNPPYPIDNSLLSPAQSVCELIEWQVQRTPERIAVSCGHGF